MSLMDLSLRLPRPPTSGSEEEVEVIPELDVVENDAELDDVDGLEDESEDEEEHDHSTNGHANGNGRSAGNGTRNGASRPLASDLQLFLDGIGRYPLLTAIEEVELAKRVERG